MIRDQPIQSHGNRTTVLSVHHSERNAIRFEKAPNGNRTSRIPRRARRRLNSPSVQMLVIASTAGLPDPRYHSSNVVIGTSKSDVLPLSTRWLLPASASLTK